METMERKNPVLVGRSPRSSRAEIVEHCRAGDRSIGQVAQDFDLTETAVRSWVNQAETCWGTPWPDHGGTDRSSPGCVGRTVR